MTNYKELEQKIRDLLDRNGFSSQKLPKPKNTPPNAPPEAFRLRVTQPSKIVCELVKPEIMQDFLMVGSRLNIVPPHQQAIKKMENKKKEKFFDELAFTLSSYKPSFKLDVRDGTLMGINFTQPIIVTEVLLARDLFGAFENINKAFFISINILKKTFRNVNVDFTVPQNNQASGSSPFYT